MQYVSKHFFFYLSDVECFKRNNPKKTIKKEKKTVLITHFENYIINNKEEKEKSGEWKSGGDCEFSMELTT